MSKRGSDERIAFHKEKLRKLEEKRRNPPRRCRIIYSSTDSDSSDSEENTCNGTADKSEEKAGSGQETAANSSSQTVTAGGVTSVQPDLDPDILAALGAKTGDGPEYGENIHDNLVQLWTPLLKKGMPKDDKDKILKDYLIPANCTLFQAPKLNPEIVSALTEAGRNRDKKLATSQQQLGVGITAVNRGIDILLNKGDQCKALKHLSDACRILSDLHYIDTQTRIKIISPSLDKNILNVVQDSCRDDTLFGSKLSEQIKASKAIEKQGLQIKKPPPPVTHVPSTSNPRTSQPRGNWAAPPRSYPNKNRRGGNKKLLSFTRKPAAITTTRQSTKPSTRAQSHR